MTLFQFTIIRTLSCAVFLFCLVSPELRAMHNTVSGTLTPKYPKQKLLQSNLQRRASYPSTDAQVRRNTIIAFSNITSLADFTLTPCQVLLHASQRQHDLASKAAHKPKQKKSFRKSASANELETPLGNRGKKIHRKNFSMESLHENDEDNTEHQEYKPETPNIASYEKKEEPEQKIEHSIPEPISSVELPNTITNHPTTIVNDPSGPCCSIQ